MFNIVETLVLHVVRDLPQYQAIALDLVHQVLTDQAKKLILLISGTNALQCSISGSQLFFLYLWWI